MHIITGLDVGGAETMLQKLIERSDRNRFEHIVISLMDLGLIGERLKKQGIHVYALESSRGLPSWRVIRRLVTLVRKIKPAIIQGWMYHGNLAAWVARRYAPNNPYLIWGIRQSLGQLSDEKCLTNLVIRVSASISAGVDAVVYNAQRARLQHQVVGFSDQLSMVIPNGFDTRVFAPSSSARVDVRREMGLGADAVLVGLIGRFHPLKDHHGFLEAAVEVVRQHDETYFLMAGGGVSHANTELSGWIAEQGLKDRVYLLGRRDDIPRLTAALDVAVSASRNEGFANVIGEAMASGVPCVVTDIGDSAMIVADPDWVVPPCNPPKLAVAICNMLNLSCEERERRGMAARERIVKEFSIEKVVGQFETIYRDITR